MTTDEIARALEEAAHSGNFFLLSAVRRMAAELRELRDQHASSRFLQGLEPSF